MRVAARYSVAVASGVLVAFGAVAAIEAIGHSVYPVPIVLDLSNAEQMRDYIASLPVGALLFPLAAWVVAAFTGGLIAALIARTRPWLFSGIVGAFVLAATLVNLVAIPHPGWLALSGVFGIVVAAAAAGKVASAVAKS